MTHFEALERLVEIIAPRQVDVDGDSDTDDDEYDVETSRPGMTDDDCKCLENGKPAFQVQ